MHDLHRDIARLQIVDESFVGLEKFSTKTRLNDLVHYFLQKFLINFKTISNDFSYSELDNFLIRHREKTQKILRDPLVDFRELLLPIPKGMIHSYSTTITKLIKIIDDVSGQYILEDLENIWENLKPNPSVPMFEPRFSLTKYNLSREEIGSLYSTKGLMVVPGDKAFSDTNDLNLTKVLLIKTTTPHYAQVIEIHHLVDQINRSHSDNEIPTEILDSVKGSILDLAYRISIFSTIMKHVQEMEHAFVKVLNILINQKR